MAHRSWLPGSSSGTTRRARRFGCCPGRATAPVGASRVGLLAFADDPALGFAAVEVLAPDGKPATAAANLFAALRRLDARGLDLLLAEPCPEEGLGSAIMDRLRRCAAGAV